MGSDGLWLAFCALRGALLIWAPPLALMAAEAFCGALGKFRSFRMIHPL